MSDQTIFAILTAAGDRNTAISAFNLQYHSRWYHRAVGGVAKEPLIDSREVTPAENLDDGPTSIDRLVLTFIELAKCR